MVYSLVIRIIIKFKNYNFILLAEKHNTTSDGDTSAT